MRVICRLLLLMAFACEARAGGARLPGTAPLNWPETKLADILMDGAHRFVERKIGDAAQNRHQYWPDLSADPETRRELIEANRENLRTIIGVIDERPPPGIEYFGTTVERGVAYDGDGLRVSQVRWPVLEGIWGEGLLLMPDAAPVAAVVLLPDADQTPEQLLGMVDGIADESQIARRLIANNVEVLIPTLVSRDKLVTDDARLERSDQTRREWLYRQAFHMGRHVIGYEVQKVMAAVDWLDAGKTPIGVAGYGEGALIAFYSAAIDTRINNALISGYFDSREDNWSQPIYRNVWSLLNRFGDAEIASLITPRQLIIEHSEAPTITGHKGDSRTPTFARVQREFARIHVPASTTQPVLIHGDNETPTGPYSATSSLAFLKSLGVTNSKKPVGRMADKRVAFDAERRQHRTVQQIESDVQQLVQKSEHVRDRFMLYELMPELNNSRWSTERRHPVHDAARFIAGAKTFRRRFDAEAMGRFDEPLIPFNARSRRVAESDKWIAYDIVLDVYEDLIAWGVLVVPKDLKPGEKRPVVVCQHGRNGVPRDTVDANNTAYNDFAAKLAERGFITFAPHNLYRGEDRYRWLDRKANSIGCSLFSFIIAQHDQILRWLDAQAFVDGDRIAFYGLSYGGETAVRIPTVLEKYCLSICSGDFNQWTRKIAATDQPFSFMRSIEWEMPYWNLGHTFDYAEMTYLMVPRPFMVERGHHDRVGRDRWVAHEFAKVRWLYAQLGIADRVEIEFFQGGHSINGEGTFEFLHKHLKWPKPASDDSARDTIDE